MKSRLHTRGIGSSTFTSSTPTCPTGYHYVPDAVGPIRGLSRQLRGCEADKVVRIRIPAPVLPPNPYPLPPSNLVPPLPPAVFAPPPASAPENAHPIVRATAPAPTFTCPTPWPWWWLLVAAGVGATLGHMAQKDKAGAKKNVGRLVNGAASRIVNAGAARVFG
jgi:hypothetical protein